MSRVIRVLPTADAAFAAFVASCEAGLSPPERDDPRALERCLRRWHPRAVVRAQSSLASFGGPSGWYAYRDGHPAAPRPDRWWGRPGQARVRFDARAVFVDANDAACDLVGRRSGDLAGRAWHEIVPPAASSVDPSWIWQTLLRTGSVESEFDCPLPDGQWRVIEYRTETTEEPGVYQSWWREVVTLPAPADARPGPGPRAGGGPRPAAGPSVRRPSGRTASPLG